MKDYFRFRQLLFSRNIDYYFDDETETYEILDCSGTFRHPIVSVPARIARYDVAAAQDLIDTARWLADTFGA
jgi:hypothetical protein